MHTSLNQDDLKPMLEGWLKKKSPSSFIFSRWQKRYFVLYKLALLYYIEANNPKPEGILPIREIVSVQLDSKYPLRMEVIAGPKTFYLECKNESQALAWTEALQELINNCKRRPSYFQPTRDRSIKFWKNTWRTTREALNEVATGEAKNLKKNKAFTTLDQKTSFTLMEEKDEYDDTDSEEELDEIKDDISINKNNLLAPKRPFPLLRSQSLSNLNNKKKPELRSTYSFTNSSKKIDNSIKISPYVSPDEYYSNINFSFDQNLKKEVEQYLPVSFGINVLAKYQDDVIILQTISCDDPDVHLYKNGMEKTSKISHSFFMHCNKHGKNEELYWNSYNFNNVKPIREYFSINNKMGITELATKQFSSQLIVLIHYLHSKGLFFRNLTPDVVYVCNDQHIVVYDFFLTFDISDHSSLPIEPAIEYTTPEMLNTDSEDTMADWWRFGVCIYEFLVGIPPFRSIDLDVLLNDIQTANIKFPNFVSQDAKSLITSLLNPEPSLRLGALGWQEICQHPFFSEIDWNDVTDLSKSPVFNTISPVIDTVEKNGSINTKELSFVDDKVEVSNIKNGKDTFKIESSKNEEKTKLPFKSPKSVRFIDSQTSEDDIKIKKDYSSNQIVLKEGWLTKRGRIIKNWKDRYFVLYSSYLLYFENDSMYSQFKSKMSLHSGIAGAIKAENKLLLGSIFIKSAIRVSEEQSGTKDRTFCMALHTNDRVYYFATDNHCQYTEWVATLQKAILAFSIQQPCLRPILKDSSKTADLSIKNNDINNKKIKRSLSIPISLNNNLEKDVNNEMDYKKENFVKNARKERMPPRRASLNVDFKPKQKPILKKPQYTVVSDSSSGENDSSSSEELSESKQKTPIFTTPVKSKGNKYLSVIPPINPFDKPDLKHINFPNFDHAMSDNASELLDLTDIDTKNGDLHMSIDLASTLHPCDISNENIEQDISENKDESEDDYFIYENQAKTPLTIQKKRLQEKSIVSHEVSPFTTTPHAFSSSPCMADLYDQALQNNFSDSFAQTLVTIPFDSNIDFSNKKEENLTKDFSPDKKNTDFSKDLQFSPILPDNNTLTIQSRDEISFIQHENATPPLSPIAIKEPFITKEDNKFDEKSEKKEISNDSNSIVLSCQTCGSNKISLSSYQTKVPNPFSRPSPFFFHSSSQLSKSDFSPTFHSSFRKPTLNNSIKNNNNNNNHSSQYTNRLHEILLKQKKLSQEFSNLSYSFVKSFSSTTSL